MNKATEVVAFDVTRLKLNLSNPYVSIPLNQRNAASAARNIVINMFLVM